MDEIGVRERPRAAKWLALSVQHVFAMFGSTVLVPLLTGMNPATALFTAGSGTLLYILVTGAKVPAFLGSSFAFIPALMGTAATFGVEYMLGGACAAGLFYCLVALVVKAAGTKWLDKALPPVVIGSVIVCIGLNLAPTAMQMAMNDAAGNYSLSSFSIALFTLAVAVAANVFLRGFFSVIPILMALAAGYAFTFAAGIFLPSFRLIDFSAVRAAPLFALPKFALPKFSLISCATFVIVSLATICEHLGDMLATGRIVGKDFTKDPGLHRTLLGDGLASVWAALWGGPPNTTYGENIGVMAISRVYSVWVVGGAAVIAVCLSFCQKFATAIQTVPAPVMGGISMLLFGIIASSGLRTLVESGVDYKNKRNLTISSIILVIGIGGGMFKARFGLLEFQLAGVALATVAGIALNLLIPQKENAR